jgi:type IV pilus assembly protein PilC
MPHYRYKVLNGAGVEQQGSSAAPDRKSAAGGLKRRGLFVVSLTEIAADIPHPSNIEKQTAAPDAPLDVETRWSEFFSLPVRDRDRILFLQQGALMLRAGLTLAQCLSEAARTTPRARFAAALGRMQRGLQTGASLSQAMAKEERLFPDIVVQMIASAEASGEMDTVFDQMADHLERGSALKVALLTSLTYPLIVVLVSVGVAGFLVVKVVPTFVKFFAARQTTLPPATQALMDLSSWLTQHGTGLSVALLLAVLAGRVGYRLAPTRRILDRGILTLPVVGNLVKMGAMAHITRTLSMLLGSGVTLVESLRIVRGLVGNRALSGCLEQASTSILAGGSLADGLRQKVLPAMVPQVIAVGERTGTLAHVLSELGRFYEQQIQAATRRLSALVEPVLILIIGGMVGFVYYAFFQAVFQIATAGRR